MKKPLIQYFNIVVDY